MILPARVSRGKPGGYSSAQRNSSRVNLRSSVIARRSSIVAAQRPPWIMRAALQRAKPSAVRGPVDLPPWSLQRFLPFIAGARHASPVRVFAPHRGHACANGKVVRQSGRRFIRSCVVVSIVILPPVGNADNGL